MIGNYIQLINNEKIYLEDIEYGDALEDFKDKKDIIWIKDYDTKTYIGIPRTAILMFREEEQEDEGW